MEIKTKYSIGDTVYICFDNKIVKGYVRRITVMMEYNNDIHNETYGVEDKIGVIYSVDVSHVFINVNDLIREFNL